VRELLPHRALAEHALTSSLSIRITMLVCALLLGPVPALRCYAQTGTSASPIPVEQAMKLAESGHCKEALPQLKRQLPSVADKALKYRVAMALVRCAMALDQEQTAADTLLLLKREAPNDPEVLYIATHYFSELGTRAAHQLQTQSPASYQAQKLDAESLESQGKNDDASAIYNKILLTNPGTPGIHYRLGQIDLDRAGPDGSTSEAKQEFQKEIEIDPSNASAHFVLGELARRSGQWDEAIDRFSRAIKLDEGFSEAYLALGMSLAASGQFAQAASPLESYVKLQPEDPAGHYQLAVVYGRRRAFRSPMILPDHTPPILWSFGSERRAT
jgi:tetratricopeptide (TPR) repeat protein